MWMMWGGEGYVGVMLGLCCVDGWVGGLVGRPLAAPAIPRSLRSRPFRPAKGASGFWLVRFWRMLEVLAVMGLVMGLVMVWLVGPSRRPGHTPLASLAPLSSHERGAGFWLLGC